MFKEAYFDGKKLAYTVTGEGEALLLLHGFPMDRRVWDTWIPDLAREFKVIAVDLPGFGDSELIAQIHSMDLMAKAVQKIVEAEQLKRFVLVGHSMGGYVSLAYASAYAGNLAGLVLFHSHARADDETAKANREKAVMQVQADNTAYVTNFVQSLFDEQFVASNPELVRDYSLIAASQTQAAVIAALKGMRDRVSHLENLRSLECPILFVLGKKDSRMPYMNLLAQVALPQHAELLLLEEVAHMGFAEDPSTIKPIILDFVARCM